MTGVKLAAEPSHLTQALQVPPRTKKLQELLPGSLLSLFSSALSATLRQHELSIRQAYMDTGKHGHVTYSVS